MDILLDPITHDIVFTNGVATVTNTLSTSLEQRLRVTLLTFSGEWFLDPSIGIDYYNKIFGKGKDKRNIDLLFQAKILEDPDVLRIASFDSSIENRTYSATFTVVDRLGTLTQQITI